MPAKCRRQQTEISKSPPGRRRPPEIKGRLAEAGKRSYSCEAPPSCDSNPARPASTSLEDSPNFRRARTAAARLGIRRMNRQSSIFLNSCGVSIIWSRCPRVTEGCLLAGVNERPPLSGSLAGFLLQRTTAPLTENALLGINNLHRRPGKGVRFDGGHHAGRSQRVSSASGALCRACTARKHARSPRYVSIPANDLDQFGYGARPSESSHQRHAAA
jgi:hypothetical protein